MAGIAVRETIYLSRRLRDYQPPGSDGRIFGTLFEVLAFADMLVDPNTGANIDIVVDSGVYVLNKEFGMLDLRNTVLDHPLVSLRVLHYDFATHQSNDHLSAVLPERRAAHALDALQSAADAERVGALGEAVFVMCDKGIHINATQFECHGLVFVKSPELQEPIVTFHQTHEAYRAVEGVSVNRLRCCFFFGDTPTTPPAQTVSSSDIVNSVATKAEEETGGVVSSEVVEVAVPSTPIVPDAADVSDTNAMPATPVVVHEEDTLLLAAAATTTPSRSMASPSSVIATPSQHVASPGMFLAQLPFHPDTTTTPKTPAVAATRTPTVKIQTPSYDHVEDIDQQALDEALHAAASAVGHHGSFLAGSSKSVPATPFGSVAATAAASGANSKSPKTPSAGILRAKSAGATPRAAAAPAAAGADNVHDDKSKKSSIQSTTTKKKLSARERAEIAAVDARTPAALDKYNKDNTWAVHVERQSSTSTNGHQLIINQCCFRSTLSAGAQAILITGDDSGACAKKWERIALFAVCVRESMFTGVGTIRLVHAYGVSVDTSLAFNLTDVFVHAIGCRDVDLSQVTVRVSPAAALRVESSASRSLSAKEPLVRSASIRARFVLCEDLSSSHAVEVLDVESKCELSNMHIVRCGSADAAAAEHRKGVFVSFKKDNASSSSTTQARVVLRDIGLLGGSVLVVDETLSIQDSSESPSSTTTSNADVELDNVTDDEVEARQVVYRRELVSGVRTVGENRVSNVTTPGPNVAIYRIGVNELSELDRERLREQIYLWDDAPTVQKANLEDEGFRIRLTQRVHVAPVYFAGYAIDKYGRAASIETNTVVSQLYDSHGKPGWFAVNVDGSMSEIARVVENVGKDHTRVRVSISTNGASSSSSSFTQFLAWIGEQLPLMGPGRSLTTSHIVTDRVDFRGGGSLAMVDGELVLSTDNSRVPLRVFPAELPLSASYAPVDGSAACITCI